MTVRGVVQGVGFRPFVYRLATAMGLTGQVANTTAGVEINIQGRPAAVERFPERLRHEAPPLAIIDSIRATETPLQQEEGFVIAKSTPAGERPGPVPPDSDVCDACLAEFDDTNDRRHLYPFITCTDCGPRYSLINNIPYDRPFTTMAAFPLCPACRREYGNPADRRFHAETTCCPTCGPRIFLCDRDGIPVADSRDSSTLEVVRTAALALVQGKIIAIKGIGGFHLAVNAASRDAVQLLRNRKKRPHKPLAVIALDVAHATRFAHVPPEAEAWLVDRKKPVVLLHKKQPFPLAQAVAPANRFIGTMLPATPLHTLLLRETALPALVMTSGNLSGVPMARENDEALRLLHEVADLFLLHDRDIVTRTDDSVVRPGARRSVILRRARGFVPLPVMLDRDVGNILAVGGMHKSTVTVTRGKEAFVSQHIGELDNLETQRNLEEVTGHFCRLLQVEPDLVVCDRHPDYCSTRLAEQISRQRGIPLQPVQHHHAHAVACMTEHRLDGPTLAITLDGSGFGSDGTMWGGEILLATHAGCKRLAHLEQTLLPGGEAAARQPWRMAASWLFRVFGDGMREKKIPFIDRFADRLPLVIAMMQQKINCPVTSSCGRLFDAAASLTGLCHEMSFEGQAAMALEMAMAGESRECYDYKIVEQKDAPLTLSVAQVIRGMVEDSTLGVPVSTVSARFHRTLAALFADACGHLAERHGVTRVVCSGGVFQNLPFTTMLHDLLDEKGLSVFLHQALPANDGCLSLGQAVAGRAMFAGKRSQSTESAVLSSCSCNTSTHRRTMPCISGTL